MKPESVSSNAKPAPANDPQKNGNEKTAQGGQTPESKTEEKSAPEAGSNNS